MLPLAWRWPPELTTIWVKLLPLVLLPLVALKAVLVAWSRPPLPTTICAP